MSQKLPNVYPIGRRPAPPTPPPETELELHFSPEALDSMITLVCEKVVAARRAREAATK